MSVDFTVPVLVVDDYEPKVRITRNLLNEMGFTNVYQATDGATAFALMHHCRFGLVITDAEMSPISGYDLWQQVRKDSALKDTPFLMLTEDGKRKTKAHSCNCIAKPLNAGELKSKVQAVLGGN